MIDIVFNDAFARSLKYYYEQREIERQVVSLPLFLGLGDIAQVNLLETRKTLLRTRNTHEPSGNSGALYQMIVTGAADLQAAAAAGESLRIWWTDLPDDLCGFIWLCEELKGFKAPISMVHVPLTLTQGNTLYQLDSISDLTPPDFDNHHIFRLETQLTRETRLAYSNQWRALKRDNTPVRVVLNGHLLSQPIDFYDRFLLANLSRRQAVEIDEAISNTISFGPSGVPDWWYRHRIDYLVSNKVLAFQEGHRDRVGFV